MDQEMGLAHLAMAEKAVADGERHIECEEPADDTTLAYVTLASLRRMQAEHLAHSPQAEPVLCASRCGRHP